MPASAACTLRRILISPVCGLTATRNPWTLNATERGVPAWLPVAVSSRRAAFAALASAPRPMRCPCHGDGVGLERPGVRCAAGLLRGERRDGLAQALARPQCREPRHHGAGAPERAGVVAAMLGVGLADAHARRRRAERGRGDLRMDGGRAVAELGGADDELVGAVVAQA